MKSAFPVMEVGTHDEGMTLRDYFAAAAMQGMMSNSYSMKCLSDRVNALGGTESERVARMAKCLAENSYIYADAMLAERDKKGAQ